MGIINNYWYHKLSPSCMESARVEEKEARIKRKNDKTSTPVICFSLAVGFQFCFSFPRACFRGFPEISAHLQHLPGGLQLEFWPTWSSSGRELFIFFVSVHLRCVIWVGERFRYCGIWGSQGYQLELLSLKSRCWRAALVSIIWSTIYMLVEYAPVFVNGNHDACLRDGHDDDQGLNPNFMIIPITSEENSITCPFFHLSPLRHRSLDL